MTKITDKISQQPENYIKSKQPHQIFYMYKYLPACWLELALLTDPESNSSDRKSPNTEQRCVTYVNENNDQNSQNNQSVSRQSSGSRTRSERSNRSVSED
jgi:hypothetical protein